MSRFEALEPICQGVRPQFDAYSVGIAMGVPVRHDHGRQDMSADFQAELRFLGMTSSPAFVRAPEGNGVAERFIRTLKEQLRLVRTFQTAEALCHALHGWLLIYSSIMNSGWSSGMGCAHRLKCVTSSRRRRPLHESVDQ